NLGQELMSRSTRLLFLDEPTSGLDPRASQEIVRLTRQLADAGRIVFLVTHDLTPEVMAQVDHLLVMAPGGRLAFFGPPDDAVRYFRVSTADAIFGRFKEPIPPEQWSQEFRESAGHRKYVRSREHLLPLRAEPTMTEEVRLPRRGEGFRQLYTLTTRYSRVKMRDRTGLLVLALQPPVLAAVMLVMYPKPIVSMFFMITLSCMWFGMSAAVRELIADRVIWHREHRIGVGVVPYVMSKLLVLGVLVAVQCALLYEVMHFGMGLGPDLGFSFWKAGVVAVLTGWVGLGVGLFTSAVWRSSEAAVGTLPLLLIPQITISGILVSLRDMTALSKAITWVTFQRYSFDALLKCGETFPKKARGNWYDQAQNGVLFDLGLKFTDKADDIGIPFDALIGIHLGMLGALLAGTMVLVRHRARRV
ncbi:MAG: ABC transporter permease, partial [Myxococcota bacterium]|nr:ABC transporter permease [Myxococcota bacterium]